MLLFPLIWLTKIYFYLSYSQSLLHDIIISGSLAFNAGLGSRGDSLCVFNAQRWYLFYEMLYTGKANPIIDKSSSRAHPLNVLLSPSFASSHFFCFPCCCGAFVVEAFAALNTPTLTL